MSKMFYLQEENIIIKALIFEEFWDNNLNKKFKHKCNQQNKKSIKYTKRHIRVSTNGNSNIYKLC